MGDLNLNGLCADLVEIWIVFQFQMRRLNVAPRVEKIKAYYGLVLYLNFKESLIYKSGFGDIACRDQV